MNHKQKYKYILVAIIPLLLFSSCYIAPEIEEKIELFPEVKYLETPEDFRVYTDYDKNEISLTWSEVEGATHYEVEYESVVDYLSGKEMRRYITISPSFSLSSFPSSNDKRYVFRVRAGKKNDEGSVLYSPFSEIEEGVMIDDFTISYVIRDGSLYYYSSTSKTSSILTNGDILKARVLVYEDDRLVENGERVLEPGENITLKSQLIVGGKVIKEKINQVSADTSYSPRGITSISSSVNKKGCIEITFNSPGINKGLENTEILFRLERRELKGGDWERVKNGEEDYFTPSPLLDPFSELSLTLIDDTPDSGVEYSYRVITLYKITQGDDFFFTEENTPYLESSKSYIADERVGGFYLSTVDTPVEMEDGSYAIKVKLIWETYHFLPSGYSFVIERRLIGESESPLNATFENLSSDVLSFTDEIILSREEKRDPKTFQYFISIKDDEYNLYPSIPLSTEEGESANVEIEGEEMVKIIKELNASFNLNNRVKLTWETEDDYSAYNNFDKNKVTFSLYKEDRGSFLLLKEGIPFSTNYFYDDAIDEAPSSYMIKAVYNEEDQEAADYEYVRNYPYSNVSSGKTLGKIDDLSASYNIYNDKILLSWTPIDGVRRYVINAKIGEENKEYYTENKGSLEIFDDALLGNDVLFTISSEDREGVIGNKSNSAKGRILSFITPTITNGGDYIKIEWNEMENVDRYLLTIYSSEEGSETVDEIIFKKGDGMEYVFSSSDLDGKNLPDNPLSSSYWFSVTPFNKELSPKVEKRIEGSWVLAPRNVKATKAAYKDKVDVTWESVPGASGYVVESKRVDEEVWKRNTVFGREVFSHYDPEGEYIYRVATIIDDKEGPFSPLNDDSIGFALLPSPEVEGKDEGNGIYSVTFKEVKGADSYMIRIPYWENMRINITSLMLSSPTDKTSGFINGEIKYKNGYYTYYFEKKDLTHSVSLSLDLYSVNSAIEGIENYSKPKSVKIIASSLNEREVVNLTLYTLRQIVEKVDTAFEGDWWAGSSGSEYKAKTYISDDSKIKAESSCGKFAWDSSQNLGYISVVDFSFDDIAILEASLKPKASDGGGLGYLGADPFSEINSGSLTISLPYGLGVYRVEFNGFKNDLSSGSAKVTKDGISTDVNAQDTKIVILR